ncbi:MAG: hypothetical protein IIZ89_05830 [Muribaculaceae bacterium]|nr:hypothetical protein [Muribaculaceae bacterium]
MMQEETDYKRLFAEARKHLSLEWNYGKLTAVEKLAVLLSGIAFVAVLTVIGALMVFLVSSLLVGLLAKALGSLLGAQLVVLGLLGCVMAVVFAMRKTLIVDPIARYVTRLFLTPDDDGQQQS